MVTVTKPKKEIVRNECGCGAMISVTGQKMHEISKVHRTWAETVVAVMEDGLVSFDNLEPETAPVNLDPEVGRILEAKTNGADPRRIARLTRELFADRDWPDEDHPGNVSDFLREHGIPILNMPRHVDPSGANTYSTNWMAVLKASGWGKKELFTLQGFEQNWSTFLVAQEEAAKRAEEARNG
jgi:hypothetical protein